MYIALGKKSIVLYGPLTPKIDRATRPLTCDIGLSDMRQGLVFIVT